MQHRRASSCLLLFLSACVAPERSAEFDRPSPDPPSWTFNTPALAQSDDLKIELVIMNNVVSPLVIDGHVTDAQLDPYSPPRVDAVGDGRYLLYGRAGATANDWELFVWEPEPARLTGLGDIGRVSVPPLGAVFVRHADPERAEAIFELSRSEPRLVPIWTADPEPAIIVGAHRGGLLLLQPEHHAARLTLLRSAAEPERWLIELDGWTPLPDPTLGRFADGRLLIARPSTAASESDPGTWELGVLEVDRGEPELLGVVPGSWMPTNESYPAPPVAFFVDDLDVAPEAMGACVTAVRRSDLALQTRCLD
jgi:hypothetical protein